MRWVRLGLLFLAVVLILSIVVYAFCRSFTEGVNAVMALATVAAVMAALFGEWLRGVLFPLKLALELVPPTRTEVRAQQAPPPADQPRRYAWYFGLRVRNQRRWRSARNCQVVLKNIYRPGENNLPQVEGMSIPLPFHWAVVPVAPLFLTVRAEGAVVNFGMLEKGKNFEPVLLSRTLNFRHTVRPGEEAWFEVEVQAADLLMPETRFYKVSWDGEWADDAEGIKEHVKITEEQLAVSQSAVPPDAPGERN